MLMRHIIPPLPVEAGPLAEWQRTLGPGDGRDDARQVLLALARIKQLHLRKYGIRLKLLRCLLVPHKVLRDGPTLCRGICNLVRLTIRRGMNSLLYSTGFWLLILQIQLYGAFAIVVSLSSHNFLLKPFTRIISVEVTCGIQAAVKGQLCAVRAYGSNGRGVSCGSMPSQRSSMSTLAAVQDSFVTSRYYTCNILYFMLESCPPHFDSESDRTDPPGPWLSSHMTPELVGMKVLHGVVLKRDARTAVREEARSARTESGRC